MSKIVFDNKNRKGKANFKTKKYGGQIRPKPYLALYAEHVSTFIGYRVRNDESKTFNVYHFFY